MRRCAVAAACVVPRAAVAGALRGRGEPRAGARATSASGVVLSDCHYHRACKDTPVAQVRVVALGDRTQCAVPWRCDDAAARSPPCAAALGVYWRARAALDNVTQCVDGQLPPLALDAALPGVDVDVDTRTDR